MISYIGVYAQGSWGVELGTVNALNYTRPISKRWSLDFRAGMEFDKLSDLTEGLSPIFSIEPRWAITGKHLKRYNQDGGYFALHLFSRFPELNPIGKGYRSNGYPKTDLTLGFAPTFGWIFSMGIRSHIRTSVGFGFIWDKIRLSTGYTYWYGSAESNRLPIIVQAVYSLRF